MIRNYFKIAFRGFLKHKVFTLINIVGLSIGISAALVIYLIVHFDFTFDKFHKDSNRIYRVVTDYSYAGEVGHNGGVTMALSERARAGATGIDAVAPVYLSGGSDVQVPNASSADKKLKGEQGIVFSDEQYFKIFQYKWLLGSAKTSLKTPYQVVLTTEQAKKYFPKLDFDKMIGREVIYDDSVKTTVSGIIEPLKGGKTDLSFHDFISYCTGTTNHYLKDYFQVTQWTNTSSNSQLFIKLSATASSINVEKQLNAMLDKHNPKTPQNKGSTQGFKLQPINTLHFDTLYGGIDGTRTASETTLYGLLIIECFILLLGCINFINLTTAQASQRAKEIGVRKTMGSTRFQLIIQFLSETFLITLLAVLVSVALAPIILKLFKDFIPPGITLDLFNQPDIIVFLFLLTVLVSGLSGIYPALILSGYKPVTVLKSQSANTGQTRNAWLRKSLTVTQFIIAQFFIMATVMVSKQIHYALAKDLGFRKEGIVYISTPWKDVSTNKKQVFMNKIRANPQIQLISQGGAPPSSGNTNSTMVTYRDGKKEIKTDLQLKFGDENYAKVYQLRLLAGRGITIADTGKAMAINATYLHILGFNNPAKAIGATIDFNGRKRQIIGVYADFYQKSLRTAVKPVALVEMMWLNNRVFHVSLKPQSIGSDEWKKAIADMRIAWKQVYPDDEFDYNFYDESIAKFYDNEKHTSQLLTWATGLSLLISCLGLLGLAIYTTTQRTKEIGVRKVLGASVTQIVTLLSGELVWLIILAFAVVTPIAYYAMHKWMENFADRTPISWWIFALSGAGMLLAALFTLTFQTVKAAIANPVKSLRSE